MYLITATLPSVSGLSEDATVNTFSFSSVAAISDADLLDLMAAVQDFYNVTPAALDNSIAHFLSPSLDRTANVCSMRGYFITGAGLGGAAHGSPQLEDSWTLAPLSGDKIPAPSEVACKITFEGNGRSTAPVEGPGDVRPKARRTGGVYIGPLHTDAFADAAISRPTTTFLAVLRIAATELYDNSLALGQPLSVWSRADASVYPLEAVSTDNAWDTQRRRGEKATLRTRSLV